MAEAREKSVNAVFSQDWFLVPAQFDCGQCGAQSRSYGVVLGPMSQIVDGVFDAKSSVGSVKGVNSLGIYGVVRSWRSADLHGCDFVARRAEDLLQLREGVMSLVCEHCGEAGDLDQVADAVMENFVQWGAQRAMFNERQLIVADAAETTNFHDGTIIEVSETIGPSFAVVARGACTDPRGMDGTVEFMLDLGSGSYAWSARFGGRGAKTEWTAVAAVGGREVGVIVEQLGQAGIVVSSLSCTDDAGKVCVFAYEQIVEGLVNDGYGWSEKAA